MDITPDPFLDEASALTQSLEDRIFEKCAKSKYGSEKEEYYVPEDSIDELITEETIKEKLSTSLLSLQPSEQKELVGFITKAAKKVFATTILVGFADSDFCLAMREFRRLGVTDEDLPILDESTHPALTSPPWTLWKARQFRDNQWRFLVPVFVEGELVYMLERDHILPFRSVGSGPKEGTFGTVFEVEIHEAHQQSEAFMVSDCCEMVAAKTPH